MTFDKEGCRRPGGPVIMDSAAYHKTIMVLDIAGYHDPKRTTDHRLVVRGGRHSLGRPRPGEHR
jgi:hypothetical protein